VSDAGLFLLYGGIGGEKLKGKKFKKKMGKSPRKRSLLRDDFGHRKGGNTG